LAHGHELRTPINVIMGYTSLLKEGVLGEVRAAQEDALAKIARDRKISCP
jgi:signal transduction histidine kinase